MDWQSGSGSKGSSTKADDLRSIPGTHKAEGRPDSHKSSPDFWAPGGMCMPSQNKQINLFKKKKIVHRHNPVLHCTQEEILSSFYNITKSKTKQIHYNDAQNLFLLKKTIKYTLFKTIYIWENSVSSTKPKRKILIENRTFTHLILNFIKYWDHKYSPHNGLLQAKLGSGHI